MYKRSWKAVHAALIAVLALGLVATAGCGGLKQAGESLAKTKVAEVLPSVMPGAEASETPEPAATAEASEATPEGGASEGNGEENLLKNLLKIGPIHMASSYFVKEDDKTASEGKLEGDIDAKGNQHVLLEFDGKKTETYVIGEDVYLKSEGEEQFIPMVGIGKDTPFFYMLGYGGLYAMGIGTEDANKVGSESVNGFQCDKYEVNWNTLGVAALAGLSGMDYKGFAWVEPTAKALIKSQFDWTIKATSDHGAQVYHSEFSATKGTVNEITKPDNVLDINAMLTPQATAAEEATATEEPTATAAPAALAKVGQRVVLGNLAFTVTKAEVTAGPEGFEAGEGNTWVLAYVTVENVGNEDASIDTEGFVFVDASGVIYDGLVNGPSSWDAISRDVMGYHSLAPGGKVQNKILLIKIEQTLTSGLKLRYSSEDSGSTLWDLGL